MNSFNYNVYVLLKSISLCNKTKDQVLEHILESGDPDISVGIIKGIYFYLEGYSLVKEKMSGKVYLTEEGWNFLEELEPKRRIA